MASLAGKTAIVTGASRGIGRAIALEFAGAGAQLVLVAKSADLLAESRIAVAATCSPSCKPPIDVAVDLRVPMSAPLVRQRAIETFGHIDILVNCAGATRVGDFLTFTEEDWEDGFALKFSAARRLATVCWDDLQATDGTILNIVGSAGRTPGA
ncbi:MAG TPA: SDR family NAD(P)-dependent oxidoreductase, partial [Steroidobacteraceae bacterium]|nr:SDR family NAD(P)-dependent oxidoreductase [Steroidobacteraceae bacterium]